MHKMILRLLQEACPRRHGLQKPAVMFKVCRYIVITSSAPLATCLIVLSSTRRLAEGMPGLCAKPTAVGRGWKARRPWKGTRKMFTLVRSTDSLYWLGSLSTGCGISSLFSFVRRLPIVHIWLVCVFHWTLSTVFQVVWINHYCKPSFCLAVFVTQVYCLITSLV